MAHRVRLCIGRPLAAHTTHELPPAAVRHVQVLRLQPGDWLRLFDGRGGEWEAQLLQMGRHSAQVRVADPVAATPELPCAVTLAIGAPANERMDRLVEKATELGVAVIQPLLTERSVLRLQDDRAQRRREHWQGIAVAASEQCGRAVVPQVAAVAGLREWLAELPPADGARWILLADGLCAPVATLAPQGAGPALLRLTALSGPEGGFTDAEVAAARAAGFVAAGLGPRVLRSDTAPLALMAWLSLRA